MASSDTEICNMALSHIGSGAEISDLQNEKSQEAKACRRFYLPALKTTLREFRWPFAKRFVTLGLVATRPTTEWMYAYRYPSDCLDFRRLLPSAMSSGDTTLLTPWADPFFAPEPNVDGPKIPYLIGGDSSGSLIYTDLASAQAEYTALVTTTQYFPPDFDMALSYQLGALICPRLAQGDFPKKVEALLQLYEDRIDRAVSNMGNEEKPPRPPDSGFVLAR